MHYNLISFAEAIARVGAVFGQGSGPVILSDVICSGQETSLHNCTSDRTRASSCPHSQDAGVTCSPGKEL